MGMELERLHILQDKPFPEAKRVIFVNELCTGSWPLKAVLQGIQSLHHEDLRVVKLSTLIEYISKFTETNYNRINCEHCRKEGCIIMIDTTGTSFALACICSTGDLMVQYQNLVKWTGEPIQESNGRMLFKSVVAREEYVPTVAAAQEPVQSNNSGEPQTMNDLAKVLNMMGGRVVDPGEKV